MNAEDDATNAPENGSVGVEPGGGGFYLRQDPFELRLLGYVQATGSVFDPTLSAPPSTTAFSIRRARLDFLIRFYEDFEFFLELDGAPGRTALVLARLNWKLAGEALQLRAGKFISRFSTENTRSSRSLDTAERYLALNSLFLLPALDTQFGVLAHGRLGSEQRLRWSVGVYNGNGKASDNLAENNDSKEIQAKLGYRVRETLQASVSVDYSREEKQQLSLVDVGFNRFVTVPIRGDRFGVGASTAWQRGPWSVRAEGLGFRFDAVDQSTVGLYGGGVQPALFLTGDHEEGVEVLLRLQTSYLDADTGSRGNALYAATPGVNWFVNPNVRLQVHGGLTYFNGASEQQGFDESQLLPSLLTQLQFKF